MANDSLESHILMAWVKDPDFIQNTDKQEAFAERFLHCPFQEQYKLMAHMFAKLTDMSIQPWLMNLANQMVKSESPSYQQSQFKSRHTMVEFFIKQYSYGETEELRNTLWSIIK
jgi:hypothetical protein